MGLCTRSPKTRRFTAAAYARASLLNRVRFPPSHPSPSHPTTASTAASSSRFCARPARRCIAQSVPSDSPDAGAAPLRHHPY